MKLTKIFFIDLFNRYWPWLIIGLLMIGFFIFTSSFNYLSQGSDFVKWLSPDETANYNISKLYAQTSNLSFFEKYNLLAKDIIHPRSFRSDWGLVKPVSFLGLPLLYGSLAKIFGVGILPYLTPLIGALGLAFFYLLIKRIFGSTTALLSTMLAAIFPVYTYYSARSMFHNVLFLASLIAGLYFATRLVEKNNQATNYFKKHWLGWLFAFLSGLLIGLALVTRTSELLWVGPLLLIVWLFNFRRVGFTRLFIFLYGVFVAFLPILYWNNFLYGSFFSSGYPEVNSSIYSLTQSGSSLAQIVAVGKLAQSKEIIINIKQAIFKFGFSLPQSYKMFNAYIRNMFPWLFWSAGAGIVVFLGFYKHYTKKRWLFLLGWLAASLVLIIYYGSWVFYDNPDPNSFTIGNSYTRYWLPVYFGAIVFASIGLQMATNLLRKPAAIWGVRLAAIAVIATLSLQFVWLDPAEGLNVSITKQQAAREEWSKVLELTEKDSVIITRYHDKVLFPERKVIIGLFNDKNMISEYANLAKRLPVYYYNFSYTDKDVDYLNNVLFKEFKLKLILISKITDKFSLYKLEPLSKKLKAKKSK